MSDLSKLTCCANPTLVVGGVPHHYSCGNCGTPLTTYRPTEADYLRENPNAMLLGPTEPGVTILRAVPAPSAESLEAYERDAAHPDIMLIGPCGPGIFIRHGITPQQLEEYQTLWNAELSRARSRRLVPIEVIQPKHKWHERITTLPIVHFIKEFFTHDRP